MRIHAVVFCDLWITGAHAPVMPTEESLMADLRWAWWVRDVSWIETNMHQHSLGRTPQREAEEDWGRKRYGR
jgi:hypothetical protein